jgi:Flp pilus assembly pilin Flp
MFKKTWSYVNDERGVETLEWIVVGALIVAVGIAVYQGALQGQLITAVNAIGTSITGLASS